MILKNYLLPVFLIIFFLTFSSFSIPAHSSNNLSQAKLRALLAKELSKMFSNEVPEYRQFIKIVKESNEAFLKKNPDALVDAEDRVMAEKHGAIRVGTPEEIRMVTRIFAVFGMQPVEFYDLTKLPKGRLPMIATAFRPIDETIKISAFRMFCSMLHPAYIDEEIKDNVVRELANRGENNPKFSHKLRELLTIAEMKGLNQKQGKEFVREVVNSFKIDKNKPINFDLYKLLRKRNDVLADIICLGININHLTPRVYDIQDVTNRLKAAGIPMKDGGIEGPMIREGAAAILLNQTSRKAPGEPLYVSNDAYILALRAGSQEFNKLKSNTLKVLSKPNEKVQDYLERIEAALQTNPIIEIEHKARFGEIEARGVALTQKGNELYHKLLSEGTFETDYPASHMELFEQELAYYKIQDLRVENESSNLSDLPKKTIANLARQNKVVLIPITYEDFLATSAAGIFKSNLSVGIEENNTKLNSQKFDNKAILEKAMGRKIINQYDLYKELQ